MVQPLILSLHRVSIYAYVFGLLDKVIEQIKLVGTWNVELVR